VPPVVAEAIPSVDHFARPVQAVIRRVGRESATLVCRPLKPRLLRWRGGEVRPPGPPPARPPCRSKHVRPKVMPYAIVIRGVPPPPATRMSAAKARREVEREEAAVRQKVRVAGEKRQGSGGRQGMVKAGGRRARQRSCPRACPPWCGCFTLYRG